MSEGEATMATASSLQDGLGDLVENEHARFTVLHDLRRQH
jgi:hypothetical protein